MLQYQKYTHARILNSRILYKNIQLAVHVIGSNGLAVEVA